MLAIEVLCEDLMDQITRIIITHRNLFEDDFALGIHILRPTERGGDQLGDDIDRERKIRVDDSCIEAGVLLGGEGIHLTADSFDLGGDLKG